MQRLWTKDQMGGVTMGETGKPPIGVPPYWIVARDRIIELCGAIERNATYSTRETADAIKIWAKEIMLQCNLIEKVGEEK